MGIMGKSLQVQKIEKIHPHLMLMYLGIGGSSLLIISMTLIASVSSFSSTNLQSIPFPKAFVLSTFLVLTCSYFVQQIWKNYLTETDSVKSLSHNTNLLIWCTLLFFVSQSAGFHELYHHKFNVENTYNKAFFYILPAIHIIHVIAGLIYTVWLRISLIKVSKKPIRSLIFLSDDYAKIKMRMLVVYWHFLGIVWIALFIYLLIFCNN